MGASRATATTVSPLLIWSAPPAGTSELALLVTDDDAGGFVHWAVAGIPAAAGEVGEGAPITGAVEGRNDFGDPGWSGPCPPAGAPHTYRFTLYALSQQAELPEDFTGDDLAAVGDVGQPRPGGVDRRLHPRRLSRHASPRARTDRAWRTSLSMDGELRNASPSVVLRSAVDEPEGTTMAEQRVERGVRMGDVIEFTLRGERITAEAMLVTDDDVVLLDLFDGDRPAWATLARLDDVVVFEPAA